MKRRTYLTAAAATLTTTLAGCGESGGDEYQGSDGGGDGGSGDPGTDEPAATATETEDEPAAVLLDHDLVEEEGDYPEEEWDDEVRVEGTAKNQSDNDLRYVQVDVRAFNEDGQQLDTYSDITRDLKAGSEWPFQVDLYDRAPGEVADYEIKLDWQA